ncbi:MAG TPA: hypothetical protein VE152_04610, partial [Acidimicrobiales bacterium]|nr:hypothetical protein [Acidimicrobiales bacterium]
DVDESGRGTRVRFEVTAFGRTATYTLAYDYARAPEEVSWSQVEGDVTAGLAGRYVFRPSGEDDTEILYHLDVELRVPIPGFVKRRAEGRIIHTALGDLRARIEDGSGPGGQADGGQAAGEVGRAP